MTTSPPVPNVASRLPFGVEAGQAEVRLEAAAEIRDRPRQHDLAVGLEGQADRGEEHGQVGPKLAVASPPVPKEVSRLPLLL